MLLLIFLATLAVRLILAFSIPNFTYESYFHLRQVEHISETGLPLYHDPLSYGGRDLPFLPVFHYLAAFFDLFLPLEFVAKVLPNLLLSLLTVIVFLISRKMTNNEAGSLFSAGIAGFLPILFSTNAFLPRSLALPLIFLAIYSFMNIDQEKYLFLYLFTFLLASFTSSFLSLLIIGFVIYVFLSVIEKKKLGKAEIELMLASLFFYIWSQFLFFKDVLIEEGQGFIWKNIPSSIVTSYFPGFSITEALVLISIVPLLAGIFTSFRSLINTKERKLFLLLCFIISTVLSAVLKLIAFDAALTFIGLIMAIIFASFYQDMMLYFQKTKVSTFKNIFLVTMIMLLLATTAYPAVVHAFDQQTPSDEEVLAFKWINEHLPAAATVLGSVEEGNLITYYGKRKNAIDTQFNLVNDVDQRFRDINSLFTTQFETHAIDVLNTYDIQYLLLTPHAKEKFGIKRFHYLNSKCFRLVHHDGVKIYQSLCALDRK